MIITKLKNKTNKEIIKRTVSGLNGKFYYIHPADIEITFDDGTSYTTALISSSCHQNLCTGDYHISGPGDVDGVENTCDKCGTKVWGPTYINLNRINYDS